MKYKIRHETNYQYAETVAMSHNLVHLTARGTPRQTCLHHELRISIPPAVETFQVDYFGNATTLFTVQEPHRKLSVFADNVVELDPAPTPENVDAALAPYPFRDKITSYNNLMALAREDIPFLSQARCRHFLAAIAPRLLQAVGRQRRRARQYFWRWVQ